MLTEIRSDRFRRPVIRCHPGLNVVLGDENATNSIGKSTLLMVVDFAFGGSALLDHNTDLVDELGHHDYFFAFTFGGEVYWFRRGTLEPTVVYRCDEELQPQAALDATQYTAFLKQSYGISLPDLSFRGLVGLHLRVWGKPNLDVHRPLHVSQNKPAADAVTALIKTFDRYGEIKDLTEAVRSTEAKYSAVNTAIKNRLIPKIGKRDYAANEVKIAELQRQLNDIKQNLSRYATSLSQLINREVLELKFQKDDLLALRTNVQARLRRIERNLTEKRYIKSAQFSSLLEFFPDVDRDRVVRIEEFHSRLATVLVDELRESAGELRNELKRIDAAIAEIDGRMAATLRSIDEPTQLVDRVYNVAISLTEARDQNARYEEGIELKNRISSLKADLAEGKQQVLSNIQDDLNRGMRELVTSVFGEDRKSPIVTLREKSYSFEVFEDTGTGTAYAGMIVLDLTVFRLTQLPVVAHDSVLFKNIENDSVARLIRSYTEIGKQSFVALDEVSKYGVEAAALMRDQSIVQLSDEEVLYVCDWRKR